MANEAKNERFRLDQAHDEARQFLQSLEGRELSTDEQTKRAKTEILLEKIDTRRSELDAAEADAADSEVPGFGESLARLTPEAVIPGTTRANARRDEISRQTGVLPPGGPGGAPYVEPSGPRKISDPAAVDAAGDASVTRNAEMAGEHPAALGLANVIGGASKVMMLGPAAGTLPGAAIVSGAQGATARSMAGAPAEQVIKGLPVDVVLGMLGLGLGRFLAPAAGSAPSSALAAAGRGAAGAGALTTGGMVADKTLVQGEDVTADDFSALATDPMALLSVLGGAGVAGGAQFRANLRNPSAGPASVDVRNVEAAGGRTSAIHGAEVPALDDVYATGAQIGDVQTARSAVHPDEAIHPQQQHNIPQRDARQVKVLADDFQQTVMSEARAVNARLETEFRTIEDQIVSRPGVADAPVDATPILREIENQVARRSREGGVSLDPSDPVVGRLLNIRQALVDVTSTPGQPPPAAQTASMPGQFTMAGAPLPPPSVQRSPAQLTMRELVALRRQLSELGNEGRIAGRDDVPFRMVSQSARDLFVQDLDEAVQLRAHQLTQAEGLHDRLIGLQDADINERINHQKRVTGAAEKTGDVGRVGAATTNRVMNESVMMLEDLARQANLPVRTPQLYRLLAAATSQQRLGMNPFRVTTNAGGAVRMGFNTDRSMVDSLRVRLDPSAEMLSDPRILPALFGARPSITIDARDKP